MIGLVREVITIHGLGRTSRCFNEAYKYFKGHRCIGIDYPSILSTIHISAMKYVAPVLREQTRPVNILTHSMGGILLRYYLKHYNLPQGSRVVMLAPPNKGSEVIDFMYKANIHHLTGLSGPELSTSSKLLEDLGPIEDVETGIIAGNWTSLITGDCFFDRPNDGKVAVGSTKLEGMKDHIVMPYSHTNIMKKPDVLQQAHYFYIHGRFFH